MHKTSYNSMKQFLSTLNQSSPLDILEIGSLRVKNQAAYVDLMSSAWKYTGLDLVEGPNVDIVPFNEYYYPIIDNSFDVIISGQTLEHASCPILIFREAYRLLREGGKVCFIAPSAGYEHHKPDYWRIMPDGMKYLFEKADFININVSLNKDGIWRDCIGTAEKGFLQ